MNARTSAGVAETPLLRPAASLADLTATIAVTASPGDVFGFDL
jgi:hypothetical protein